MSLSHGVFRKSFNSSFVKFISHSIDVQPSKWVALKKEIIDGLMKSLDEIKRSSLQQKVPCSVPVHKVISLDVE
jgi:hypothetical protein